MKREEALGYYNPYIENTDSYYEHQAEFINKLFDGFELEMAELKSQYNRAAGYCCEANSRGLSFIPALDYIK